MHASQASVNTVRVSRSCRQRTPLREPAGRAAAMEPVREQVAGRGTWRPTGVEGRGGAKGRAAGEQAGPAAPQECEAEEVERAERRFSSPFL